METPTSLSVDLQALAFQVEALAGQAEELRRFVDAALARRKSALRIWVWCGSPNSRRLSLVECL